MADLFYCGDDFSCEGSADHYAGQNAVGSRSELHGPGLVHHSVRVVSSLSCVPARAPLPANMLGSSLEGPYVEDLRAGLSLLHFESKSRSLVPIVKNPTLTGEGREDDKADPWLADDKGLSNFEDAVPAPIGTVIISH